MIPAPNIKTDIMPQGSTTHVYMHVNAHLPDIMAFKISHGLIMQYIRQYIYGMPPTQDAHISRCFHERVLISMREYHTYKPVKFMHTKYMNEGRLRLVCLCLCMHRVFIISWRLAAAMGKSFNVSQIKKDCDVKVSSVCERVHNSGRLL